MLVTDRIGAKMNEGPQFRSPMTNFFGGNVERELGADPAATERSVFQALALTATSGLAAVFIFRLINHEKEPIWRVIGYSVLAGSAFGVLSGLARIIAHFTPEKR